MPSPRRAGGGAARRRRRQRARRVQRGRRPTLRRGRARTSAGRSRRAPAAMSSTTRQAAEPRRRSPLRCRGSSAGCDRRRRPCAAARRACRRRRASGGVVESITTPASQFEQAAPLAKMPGRAHPAGEVALACGAVGAEHAAAASSRPSSRPLQADAGCAFRARAAERARQRGERAAVPGRRWPSVVADVAEADASHDSPRQFAERLGAFRVGGRAGPPAPAPAAGGERVGVERERAGGGNERDVRRARRRRAAPAGPRAPASPAAPARVRPRRRRSSRRARALRRARREQLRVVAGAARAALPPSVVSITLRERPIRCRSPRSGRRAPKATPAAVAS